MAERNQTPPTTIGTHCRLLVGKFKLILCHVGTSRLLNSHQELKSVMMTYGFVCLSDPADDASSAWSEFIYPAAGNDIGLPRPTLPGHEIDGLHFYTYRAFLDAVNYYLRFNNISDHFKVPLIPVRFPRDFRFTWKLAEVDNYRFVYRAETLKQEVIDFYDHHHQPHQGANGGNGNNGNASESIEASSSGSNSAKMDGSGTSSTPYKFF